MKKTALYYYLVEMMKASKSEMIEQRGVKWNP